MIDETQFVKNERSNEYDVSFRIAGYVRMTIEAASLDEARVKAAEMLEDEDLIRDLDEVSDADVSHVRKCPAMFLISRDGKPMQVSHLREGDLPRQPTEHGF